MIRSLLFGIATAALCGVAMAAEPPDPGEDPAPVPEAPVGDDPLEPYRLRFDVLTDRTIGTASRPVIYNWRKSKIHLAATGSFLMELNNFNSGRLGASARLPSRGALFEFGAAWVWVGDTPSSRLLALTPYRQPGRPERIEIEGFVTLPLAEGIVTSRPRWFPAAQLVFNAHIGLRYSLYPTGWSELTPRQVLGAIVSPALSDREIENLEGVRRSAMEVDPQRYGVMVGIGNDLYFKQGVFLSPRLLFHVPLLAPATGSQLYFWADLGLSVGYAL